MLIFNSKKEFVGIDEKDLQILGFTNLTALLNEVDDFADMFVKKPGFIHNFKHVNWIDFVECADSPENAKVIIDANAKNFQCFMSVEIIYLTNEPTSKAYLVHLNNIKELTDNETEYASVNLLQQSMPIQRQIEPIVPEPIVPVVIAQQEIEIQNTPPEIPSELESILPLELDFEDSGTQEHQIQMLEDDLSIDLDIPEPETTPAGEVFDNGYTFDPLIASSELGLPVDLIEEFIEDFIAQAKEFKDELYQAYDDGDRDKLQILSHKLKGVAANLRIEDALESLTIVNTSSDNNKILLELDTFYKIIAKLSGETIEVSSTQQTIVPEDNLIVNDLDLDIFSTPKIETKHDIIEIDFKEEVIDDFELDFKDEPEIEEKIEITDKEVPDHIDLPELADDDFLPQTELAVEPELEDELFTTPDITYSRENIANEIGLDQISFNELFDDYILEATQLNTSISVAIETENYVTWKHLGIKLKGMSDNMRILDFTKELETIIQTQDFHEAKEANTSITQYINQLSNIKE